MAGGEGNIKARREHGARARRRPQGEGRAAARRTRRRRRRTQQHGIFDFDSGNDARMVVSGSRCVRLRLAQSRSVATASLTACWRLGPQRRPRATPCASAPCMPVVCSAAVRARGPPERAQSEWFLSRVVSLGLSRTATCPGRPCGAKASRQRCALLRCKALYADRQRSSLRAWSVWRAAPLIAKPRPTCGLAAPHAAHIARVSARESVHTEASGRA